MEQTKLVNLPIIGRVQHGEKKQNKVTEYGYFIAKIQDDFMKAYLEKFDKLFKGKKSIDIEFFDENPLSMKYARFNQSGEACSCKVNSDNAKLKIKNGWQDIKCDLFNCQYRQRNQNGKMACNRIGWLKFLIPSVCQDRIWLMRITGQTSLDRLDDYFTLQKIQGNSIKGHYTLFLKQEEQENFQGQTFNNYILDIQKKDNFISNNQNSKITQNQEILSTENSQKVNNYIAKEQKEIESNSVAIQKNNIVEAQNIEETKLQEKTIEAQNETIDMLDTKKSVKQKKQTKSKNKKTDEKFKEQDTNEQQKTIDDFENYYVFESLSIETITTKDGTSKEYPVGKFYDANDKVHNIIVKPEYKDELENCELGTMVELPDIKEIGGKKFAISLKFIQKMQKNIAA